jgi:hypothetical protein
MAFLRSAHPQYRRVANAGDALLMMLMMMTTGKG